MNSLKPVGGLVLFSLLSVTTSAIADEAAITLLNRMNQALHGLTYKGTLAYLRGNSLSTLHINHKVVNGVENETVVRLNESGSKVSRELKGFSLASIPRINSAMKKVYSFDLGRTNRIANLPCVIVTARPKDRERYLQKYCINEKTAMLLDYVLVDKSHKPVEQFMFTTIDIATTNFSPQMELASGSQKKRTSLVAANSHSAKNRGKFSSVSLGDGWVVESLPKGYGIRRVPVQKNKGATKHYVISDGLSSLSVFVSPFTNNDPAKNIIINSGALNVLSQRKNNFVFTVVGEVPESTLKNILNNIRRK